MRFEVPQFIDVEDKIFGPLTFKQFIYLLGGGALAYVSFKILPFPVWPVMSLVFIGFGGALAFYRLNNRTFVEVAQSWISYMLKGKIYVWKRTPVKQKPVSAAPAVQIPVPKPKETTDKTITDLANNLDILDRTY